MRVEHVQAEDTYDLRRRVLYGHWPEAEVHYPEDEREGAFHLGARDEGGRLVAVASWYPETSPFFPVRRAYRLRGMAVDATRHGQGTGRLLFEAGVGELRARDVEVLWANARDSAVPFYRRLGMSVMGDGFVAAGGIPHHVVVLELTP